MAKHTPFYAAHIKYGGKMVEFAGYDLPIQYEGYGLIAEHHAVRQKAGLFDVSHMGEFIITGENAEAFVDYIVSGDVRGLGDGQIRYTLMPNKNGGAVVRLKDPKYRQELLSFLINKKLPVERFEVLEPSLEEIFVEKVGDGK